jgi:hypothetical protein
MDTTATTVAFLGTGTMGEALLKGSLDGGLDAHDVWVTARSQKHVDDLVDTYGAHGTTDNAKAASNARIGDLAVPPRDVPGLIAEVANHLRDDAVVVSLATASPSPTWRATSATKWSPPAPCRASLPRSATASPSLRPAIPAPRSRLKRSRRSRPIRRGHPRRGGPARSPQSAQQRRPRLLPLRRRRHDRGRRHPRHPPRPRTPARRPRHGRQRRLAAGQHRGRRRPPREGHRPRRRRDPAHRRGSTSEPSARHSSPPSPDHVNRLQTDSNHIPAPEDSRPTRAIVADRRTRSLVLVACRGDRLRELAAGLPVAVEVLSLS